MRSKKTKWFSRLHFGAGGKTSRKRPSSSDGLAQSGHTGSFTRFISATKLWLLSTLPVIQFASRPAPGSKVTPSRDSDGPSSGKSPPEQDQRQGRKARLEELQIQALEDERELRRLQKREHEINIENGEIKRGLTLAAVVIVGATVIAGITLGVAAPSIDSPVPDLLEISRLLRW